jgi:hypothetical protein
MKRVVAGLGELLVRGDHDQRIVVLDRQLQIGETVLLEQRALPQRGLDQRLRGRPAVLAQQPGVQRAGIHPDPDRYARLARRASDLRHLVVESLDVAGVHPYRGAPGIDRGEDVLRLEVDVRYHRDARLAGDLGQRVGVVLRRHRDPYDVAAGRGQLGDLLERSVDVRGHRGSHRLHRDRGAAADRDRSHPDLPGGPTARWSRAGTRLAPERRRVKRNDGHGPREWSRISPSGVGYRSPP